MSTTMELNESHIPLLHGFLSTIIARLEQLLSRFAQLSELSDMVPESDRELRWQMDLLLLHCSMELSWCVQTYETYKQLQDMILPSSSTVAGLWAETYGL
ncbi:hypothetical protein NXS19_013512 [Fusarium pseudograminearum]|uniref:Uncharacterized protein n=1 Tax=Fusarium pseudograminearum (strain CS3096) TaxID=1028729 RepID=K3W195_FUSPC|nr:hypothetical protein FPSE_04285 [Fusarium pseudograminearum CS3096]EKJ75510.1 hypothetical protein FPSE_04285 [Fusarium pseudograminearum CS3096]UZP45700.1 hypothetical protein NXS19_013512 [Fusarium pseudograminearum]